MISLVSVLKLSSLLLAAEAEQAGFGLTLSERNPKCRFSSIKAYAK